MNFKDFLKQVAAGGLPAALDYGNSMQAQQPGDPRTEQTAPQATARDVVPGINFSNFQVSTLLFIGLGVLGIIYVMKNE